MDVEKIIKQRNSFLCTKDAVIRNKEETILEHCFDSPAMKILFDRGLITPLGTCPETLWISPSDRLLGKIQLKPPMSNSILKAFQHQNIMEIGAEFEKRIQLEMEQKIEEARTEIEEFEKFECNYRINFHLKQLQDEHTKGLDEQRMDLLEVFQEEREQLINSHLEECAERENCLKKQFQFELKQKIEATESRITKLWNEDRRKFEEKHKQHAETIEEMQKSFEKTNEDMQREEMRIKRRLYKHYRDELEQKKYEQVAQHMAELMHIVVSEREMARSQRNQLRQELQIKIDELKGKNEELLNWKPELRECPNEKIWRTKCYRILQNYEAFIEYVMKATPGQGRYYLPIQKFIDNKLSESKHPNCFFNCSYEGGYIYGEPDVSVHDDETMVSTPKDPICDDSVYFLPKEDTLVDETKSPFVIGDCQPVEMPQQEPEEMIPEDIQEDGSLSSLEYEDNRYVNLKTFVGETCQKTKWCEAEVSPDEFEISQESNHHKISFQSGNVRDCFSIEELLNTITSGKLSTKIEMELSRLSMDCSANDQCQAVRNILVHAINLLFDTGNNFKSIKLQMGHEGRRFSGGLLTAVDSIELLSKTSRRSSLIPKQMTSETIKSVTSKKFSSEIFDLKHKSKPYIQVSNEEYMKSFHGVPRYLQNPNHRLISLWDYRPMGNVEWNNLFDRIREPQQTDAGQSEEFNEVDDDIVLMTSQGILKNRYRH